MNEYNNYQDDSFDEEAELKRDIETVKKLNEFSIDEETTKKKNSSPIGIFLMLAGLLSTVVLLFLFVYNYSFNTEFEFLLNISIVIVCFIVALVISLLMFVIGLISYVNSKSIKVLKNGETTISITTEEEFKYSNSKKDVDLVYIDEPVILNAKKKEAEFVSPLADLEDEEEAQGANLVQPVRNYDSFDLDTKVIMERFISFGRNNDMEFSPSHVVEFISHLGYSHLMMIKDISKDARKKVLNAIQNTFSASSFYIDCKYMNNEGQIVAQNDFTNALNRADNNQDEFVFLMLDNLSSYNLKMILMSFLPSIYDSNNRHKVRTPYSDKQYQISPNLYFLIVLNDDDKGLESDDKVLRYTSIFSLRDSIYNGEKKDIPLRKISVSDFKHVIEMAKEDKGLDEEIWKKLDGLETFVSKIKRYSIDNDVANNIENHVALTLSIFDSEEDVLDSVLSDDLLPSIIKFLPKDKVFEENGLVDYIKENFNSEYALPKTDTLFKDYKNLLNNPELKKFSRLMGNEIKVEQKETINTQKESTLEANDSINDETDSGDKVESEEKKIKEFISTSSSEEKITSDNDDVSKENVEEQSIEESNEQESLSEQENATENLFDGLLNSENKEKEE